MDINQTGVINDSLWRERQRQQPAESRMHLDVQLHRRRTSAVTGREELNAPASPLKARKCRESMRPFLFGGEKARLTVKKEGYDGRGKRRQELDERGKERGRDGKRM